MAVLSFGMSIHGGLGEWKIPPRGRHLSGRQGGWRVSALQAVNCEAPASSDEPAAGALAGWPSPVAGEEGIAASIANRLLRSGFCAAAFAGATTCRSERTTQS